MNIIILNNHRKKIYITNVKDEWKSNWKKKCIGRSNKKEKKNVYENIQAFQAAFK